MKRWRQIFTLAIEIDAPQNRLSTSLESGQILSDPIRPHLAIRVGSQDHASALTSFKKPCLGDIHRATSGGACVRYRRGQGGCDDGILSDKYAPRDRARLAL